MSRWILIPQAANVRGISATTDKLEFRDYFLELLVPRLPRKTVEEIRIVRELVGALAECNAAETKKLRDEAHKALVAARPDNLSGKLIARLVDFDDAIVGADDDAQHARRAMNSQTNDLLVADAEAASGDDAAAPSAN